MTSNEVSPECSRHFVTATIAALSVFAFGLLPLQMSGLVSFVTVVLLVLTSRLGVASLNIRPNGSAAVGHLISLGVVYIGSLILVATVLHNAVWANVVLACVVHVTVLAGAWIPGTRQ